MYIYIEDECCCQHVIPYFSIILHCSITSITGLFNLRASDIAFNPFFISYAIIKETTVRYVICMYLSLSTGAFQYFLISLTISRLCAWVQVGNLSAWNRNFSCLIQSFQLEFVINYFNCYQTNVISNLWESITIVVM